MLRRAGFSNVNLDIMYGLPGQTESSFLETVGAALTMSPEHLSCYSLIPEEGTEMGRRVFSGEVQLPQEEVLLRMEEEMRGLLKQNGYERYEISNYALPGYESRHNTRYWKRSGYLGIGAGASSLIGHTRWRNTRDIGLYLTNSSSPELLKREEERLDLKAEMEEFMFLGLRMKEGVTEQDFREMFGRNLTDVYGDQIQKQLDGGFLKTDGRGRFAFTGRGMEVSNVLLAEYL
jgi:oxygen-independent coproporphyrinogen-3 oxidase